MKCTKCGDDFSPEEIDEHNMICSYAFSSKDYENLIPCEICDELILFNDYQNHIEQCRVIPSRINPFFSETEVLNVVDNINENPLARSIFNMFVGNLPEQQDDASGPIVEPPPAAQANITPNQANITPNQANITPNQNHFHNTILNIFERTLNDINQSNDELNYEQMSNLEDHVVGISDINKVSKIVRKDLKCPICSCEKTIIRETKCKHHFCDECLSEWLKSSKKCPICMIDLE